MTASALNLLNSNSNISSLINPFLVKGLYPKLSTQINLLPFEIPNPSLLENLPYLFNTVDKWQDQTLYQQIIDPLSSWHRLVDNCIVNYLVFPVSTADAVSLEGPIHIETITIEQPLTTDSNLYRLNVTKYIGKSKKRITHDFHSVFFYRAYLGITNPVIDTYMAVVKDILNAQPNNEIEIKGYSIKYVSDMLYINNQAYENIDLPIVAWLMYILFN